MNAPFADVKAFRATAELPNPVRVTQPPLDRRQNALNLIVEEFKELTLALAENDTVEAADAMADLVYVVLFAAAEHGIPLADVWAEVQRTNMAKADPETGRFKRNTSGKISKPKGWQPPDIAAILARHGLFAPAKASILESPLFFSFAEALNLLKAERPVARAAWDDNVFIVLMPPLYLPPYNTQGTDRKVNDRTAKWIGEDQPLDCHLLP